MVLSSVSGMASVMNPFSVSSTTVKQAPSTAIESPRFFPFNWQSISITESSSFWEMFFMVPSCWMIPVNIAELLLWRRVGKSIYHFFMCG